MWLAKARAYIHKREMFRDDVLIGYGRKFFFFLSVVRSSWKLIRCGWVWLILGLFWSRSRAGKIITIYFTFKKKTIAVVVFPLNDNLGSFKYLNFRKNVHFITAKQSSTHLVIPTYTFLVCKILLCSKTKRKK